MSLRRRGQAAVNARSAESGGRVTMNTDPVWPRFFLIALMGFALGHRALACDEVSASAKVQERDAESRTFLMDVQLTKSGAVRAVQVWQGTGPLRAKAVRFASARRYHPPIGYSQSVTTIEVTFPLGKAPVPKIRGNIVLGVPACIYVSSPIQWPLISWVNKLLSNQPILPFPLPSGASNQ